ncbi:MAG: ROK family glucokinase [Lachnospiraceae bacterium]|nr:ROK family glucokinase [Lachnospiraceae bacterium]
MEQVCFGIDVGGTTVKCGLFSIAGELIEKWEIPTRTQNCGEAILPDIAGTVLGKMNERGIEKASVVGIGIGIPGPVKNGRTPGAVNLYWGEKDLVAELSGLTGLPVCAGNDANVAALGEMWAGAAKGQKTVLMVTLGTGVGGGAVVDEKIVEGAHGAGAEIGHLPVDDELEVKCNCGNSGCLEQFCSATGIVRIAREEIAKAGSRTVLQAETVTAKDVFDVLESGDSAAVNTVEIFARYLGRGIAMATAVLDPETVVIGGGVSRAGKKLLDPVAENYRKYAFSACKATSLVLASLGNDAGIYGAARLVL